MAEDKTLTEGEDDIEVVEVAELPKPGETPPAKNGEKIPPLDEGDHEQEEQAQEEEDARLVADDDDEDEDAPDKGTPAHKKRVKRRQIQKQARDRTLAKVAFLEEQNADFARQLAEIRGNQITQSESQIDERLAKVREDVSLADRILAKAIEAGNGDDAAAALRLRDEAKASEQELLRSKGSVAKAKEGAPDPVVTAFANDFKRANASWYGVDPVATEVCNRIDAQVAAEGFPPNTKAYWNELARRTDAHFRAQAPAAPDTPGRKRPPPQGQSREHVPQSTRREVYVTPERKQAMVEAGIWDDIPRRNKMLKAYADYDRDQSAS